jgi:hypothetical protein
MGLREGVDAEEYLLQISKLHFTATNNRNIPDLCTLNFYISREQMERQ